MTTHIYTRDTLKGPKCIALSSLKTKFTSGLRPVLLRQGNLTCQTSGGQLETIVLTSHEEYTPMTFLNKFQDDMEQGKGLRLLYLLGNLDSTFFKITIPDFYSHLEILSDCFI